MHLLMYPSEEADVIEPTSLPIWLVDPKTQFATELNSKQVNGLNLNSYTTSELLYVGRYLLHHGIPISLVNEIFSIAGWWIKHEAKTYQIMEGWAPMEREYFRLTIPQDFKQEHLHFKEFCALTIECVSHDQGRAIDMPQFSLTYVGCNSWIEFEIVGTNGEIILPRLDMCRNFRACGVYRRHMLHITDRFILKHLTPGCHIIVYLRAQLLDWTNHAKYGRLMVQMAYGINHDIDLLDKHVQVIPSHDDSIDIAP